MPTVREKLIEGVSALLFTYTEYPAPGVTKHDTAAEKIADYIEALVKRDRERVREAIKKELERLAKVNRKSQNNSNYFLIAAERVGSLDLSKLEE